MSPYKLVLLSLNIITEVANIFRFGVHCSQKYLGKNKQLCFTEFICVLSKENYNPWSVASQLVAVRMITDQAQKRLYPLSRANEEPRAEEVLRKQ